MDQVKKSDQANAMGGEGGGEKGCKEGPARIYMQLLEGRERNTRAVRWAVSPTKAGVRKVCGRGRGRGLEVASKNDGW